jgi:hypothetical protein
VQHKLLRQGDVYKLGRIEPRLAATNQAVAAVVAVAAVAAAVAANQAIAAAAVNQAVAAGYSPFHRHWIYDACMGSAHPPPLHFLSPLELLLLCVDCVECVLLGLGPEALGV